MPSVGSNVDISPVNAMLAYARSSFSTPTQHEIGDGAREGMQVYLGAMRRRFSAYSQRGGTWADQAPSTKLARFYRSGGRLGRTGSRSDKATRRAAVIALPFPILYETGALYSSLVPGESDNIFATLSDRIRGGSEKPYGLYLQIGNTRMPAREFLVQPEDDTLREMSLSQTQGVREMWARAAAEGNLNP